MKIGRRLTELFEK